MQLFPHSCVARDGAQVASPPLQNFIFTVCLFTFRCKCNFLLNNCLTTMIIYRVFLDKSKKLQEIIPWVKTRKYRLSKFFCLRHMGLLQKIWNLVFVYLRFIVFGVGVGFTPFPSWQFIDQQFLWFICFLHTIYKEIIIVPALPQSRLAAASNAPVQKY